jgi:hypothetical protein
MPLAVTTTLPVVAPAGTGTVMEPTLHVVGVAGVLLKLTVPGLDPKPVPEIVTVVPMVPVLGEIPVMFGATVKLTPLLATPFAVTTTLPVVAPGGTGTVIEAAFQLVGDAVVPLKVTAPGLIPKPVPAMVTLVPTIPEPGDKLAIFGITVNAAPLLATPPTVTTTVPLPAAAAVGTEAVIDVELQFVAVATTLLNVTVLLPCELPNPEPVIVTDVPATPDDPERLLMLGTTVKATPLLGTPPTVTTTVPLPPVALAGTEAVMDVALQLVGVAATPLNVTVLLPCALPNPEPVIVTEVPATPDVADKLAMLGTTVKATPLLGPPFTVTTT